MHGERLYIGLSRLRMQLLRVDTQNFDQNGKLDKRNRPGKRLQA
jgi:hypothetical protein